MDHFCPKCHTVTDDLDVVGDNEMLFTGDEVGISMELVKKIKEHEQPFMIEFPSVYVALSLKQFEELYAGIMKAKPIIEKKLEAER